VGGPPGLYALHICRTPEVICVLGLAQPAALTGRFTHLATLVLRAIALVPEIAWIGVE